MKISFSALVVYRRKRSGRPAKYVLCQLCRRGGNEYEKNLLGKMVITGIISAAMLASTAASTWAADKSDKDVLRVGMECAYAPFNWTRGYRYNLGRKQGRTYLRQ